MRIKLKRGYQNKLILKAKESKNFSWKELAKELDCGITYLSFELNNEKRLLSKEIYEKLCKLSSQNYYRFIKDKLDDNWGRAKGGKNSTRNPKLIIEKSSKDLAEFMGVMLGDGNIWTKEGGYYYITIAGNYLKDKDYLESYINPLFRKLFGKVMQVRKNKNDNGMCLKIGDKDIVFTLGYWGFPSGDKKENNVRIPSWIFHNEEYLRACIRGLIDTDGSVCPITGRDYPYIWFSSNIKGIQESFNEAMNTLKFDTSKWSIVKNRAAECYIAKKEHIARFLREVGFSNSKHKLSWERCKNLTK